MEAGPPIYHGLGILRHFTAQVCVGLIKIYGNGIAGAHSNAAATAHTFAVVNSCLPILHRYGVVSTDFGTQFTAHAVLLYHMRFPSVVLLHLTRTAAAAHADVFQGTAKAGGFMTLEMGQGNKHIRIHDGPANLGIFYIFAALNRHLHLVVALDAVGNNYLTAGGHGVKPIEHSRVQMIQSVLAAAHVKGVAISEEGLAAPLFYEICHGFCPIGAQKRQVARLAEMHFNGYIFVVEVNFAHAGGFHQPGQLLL